MKQFVPAPIVFLPSLSVQQIRHWFEDGLWRMPGPGLKANALPEPGVLYIMKQLLNQILSGGFKPEERNTLQRFFFYSLNLGFLQRLKVA